MFFWQDYFLYMWPAPTAKHFEPIEHNYFAKWLKNESFALQPYPSKFQDFEIFVWFGFSSSSPNEHVFYKMGQVFVVSKVWNQLYDCMHSF
jgi:hypothetical protein